MENRSDRSGSVRPVYFLTVFWGPLYRSYFFNYCIPSLLASRNLGMLSAEDGHKYVMCTTTQDWNAIQSFPAMERLRRHATPVHLPIDSPSSHPDPTTAKFRTMVLGQKLLIEAAYRDGVLGSNIIPDSICANGSIETALRYIKEGSHAVLTPALSFNTDDLFPSLVQHSILQSNHGDYSVAEIDVAPRMLLRAAIPHLCDFMYYYNWDARANFAHWPSSCLWLMPGARGMLMHRSYFDYTMIDFAKIARLDTSGFETGSIENQWLSDNFSDPSKIRVAQDSDELAIVYWSPRGYPIPPHGSVTIPVISDLQKGFRMRRMQSIHLRLGDVQKAANYRHPVRLHSEDLGSEWYAMEQRARRVMLLFLGDVYPEFVEVQHRRYLPLLRLWWSVLKCAVGLTNGVTAIWIRWMLLKSYFVLLASDPRMFFDKFWRRLTGQRI
jgi:hypothetical protein